MRHPDPQEGREVHQDREDKEAMEHPGLAEHDSIHEDSRNGDSWGSRHTDVVRSDGGGISHVAGRVAHAQQTKDAYGDHSPSTRMPVGDLSAAMARTSPRVPYPKQEKEKRKPSFSAVDTEPTVKSEWSKSGSHRGQGNDHDENSPSIINHDHPVYKAYNK